VALRPVSVSPPSTRRPATATASGRPARATGGETGDEARPSCGAPIGCAITGEHSPKASSRAAHPVLLARNSHLICIGFSTRNLSNARCDQLCCGDTRTIPSRTAPHIPTKVVPAGALGYRFAQAALVALQQTCATTSRLRSIVQAGWGCIAPASQSHDPKNSLPHTTVALPRPA